MPVCNKIHVRKVGNRDQRIPCYYIAGVCVTNPIHEGGLLMFLRSTYPYHHSPDYKKSRRPQSRIVPNDLIVAEHNI